MKTKLCLNCEKQTTNEKFCSLSCAASFNNKICNGRKTGRDCSGTCKICHSKIPSDYTRCIKCRDHVKTNSGQWKDPREITKGDILTNDTQRYRRIRHNARHVAEKNKLLIRCIICDYEYHVECAHIKPISDFTDNTLLTEINAPLNLCGLCPNHHWEYDHNHFCLLSRTGIEPVPTR